MVAARYICARQSVENAQHSLKERSAAVRVWQRATAPPSLSAVSQHDVNNKAPVRRPEGPAGASADRGASSASLLFNVAENRTDAAWFSPVSAVWRSQNNLRRSKNERRHIVHAGIVWVNRQTLIRHLLLVENT
ncbi:hypothetical protein EYF80_038028 [Liparis tanakae]|uniref:Uncharacterized protein n=1 Tax=Liparis tanakae TaxID=230148 RepID=A0A4Z2GDU7_9TELE|nr:hypothetical protein EYF80_038028 [Liparis tanakae]